MHIVRNYLDHNKTSNSYKWSEGEPEKVQPQLHGGSYTPQHKHPQTFVEFDVQNSATKEFRFLVHSHIYGDNACRPILKVQLFPGEGRLGEKYVYDFNEPLPKENAAPIKHVSKPPQGMLLHFLYQAFLPVKSIFH